MGGLSRHMMHPHDNLNLTFGDLYRMIAECMGGEVKFTEKLDGFNIHIMNYMGQLKFARNTKDLQEGGFDLSDIDNRFSNDRVRQIFREAYIELQKNPICIPDWDIHHVTLNCEIIRRGRTNIMFYGENMLVPHGYFRWTKESGKWVRDTYEPTSRPVDFESLHGVSIAAWLDGGFSDHRSVNKEMTIQDYYQVRYLKVISKMFPELLHEITPEAHKLIFGRFFGIDKTNLRELRKIAGADIQPILYAKNEIVYQIKRYLDEFILSTGTAIVSRCDGINAKTGWSEYTEEVLRADLAHCEGDEKFEARWRACCHKVLPIEGVVFEWEGNMYKWTGPFAPINQLLGASRFSK